MKQFLSKAQWPEGSICQSRANNITSDYHQTELAAQAVCRMLERDGLGGEGKIFPIKTWVEDDTGGSIMNGIDKKLNEGKCTCGAWNSDECCCGAWDTLDPYFLKGENEKLQATIVELQATIYRQKTVIRKACTCLRSLGCEPSLEMKELAAVSPDNTNKEETR